MQVVKKKCEGGAFYGIEMSNSIHLHTVVKIVKSTSSAQRLGVYL